MYSRFSLEGCGALVIGGSRSFGRAIAHAFAEHGAEIAIGCCSAADAASGLPDAGIETAQECSGRGARASVIDEDLSLPGAGTRLFERAIAALERIDVVAFCIGARDPLAFDAISDEEIQRKVAIHVAATTNVLQAGLPAMRASGWGRILMIDAASAARPDGVSGLQTAAKAAQRRMCLDLARDLARDGVTINVLMPGPADAALSPSGRGIVPSDLSGAAVMLCSEAGGAISGVELPIAHAAHL
jgi:3-oxoacyl-[acyl-carrier protein] reductase